MFRVEIRGTVDPNSKIMINIGLSHFYKSLDNAKEKLKQLNYYSKENLEKRYNIYVFDNKPCIVHYDLI